MVNIKKDDKDKRTNLVHLAFSENELKDIDKYRGKTSAHTTRTSFIRDAINEKIMRIENPEKFGRVSSNEEQLKEIKELQLKQLKLSKAIEERLSIVNGINETFKALKQSISKEEIAEYCKTIISMLKVHKKVKIQKLMLLTGYKQKIIYDCIAANDILEINDSEEVFIDE